MAGRGQFRRAGRAHGRLADVSEPSGDKPLRIGTAERQSAMKALDAHLDAGRLGVEEYADRSAAAANALLTS
jgi:hypothetical protein